MLYSKLLPFFYSFILLDFVCDCGKQKSLKQVYAVFVEFGHQWFES